MMPRSMPSTGLAATLLLLLLLASCANRRTSESMRLRLRLADSLNQCYIPFASDTLIRPVADYYARRGDPNTRMLAYYLLGSSYRDMGDTERAMRNFHMAVASADTTSDDCDRRRLSRVHGQMALLYYEAMLPKEQLAQLCLAEHYARRGGDTLAALLFQGFQADSYDERGLADTAAHIRQAAIDGLRAHGFRQQACQMMGPQIANLVQRGRDGEARLLVHDYEHGSGYFDRHGDIEQGHEIYYYSKGLLLLHEGQPDAAFGYFDKLLHVAKDANDSLAAYAGLAAYYKLLNKSDSAALYYELSMDTQAQSVRTSMADQLFLVQAGHSQYVIGQKDQEMASMVRAMLAVCLLACIVGLWAYRRTRTQRSANATNTAMLNDRLTDSSICRLFQQYADSPDSFQLTPSHWKDLQQLVETAIPNFRPTLDSPAYPLRAEEYRICLLVRLFFSPAQLSTVMGLPSSHISMLRKRMLKKVYHIEGTPREFDWRVCQIT